MNKVYWNGRLTAAHEAHLPAQCEAVRFGEGVFTTLKIRDGRPRFFAHHWQRLTQNARQLDYGHTWEPGDVEAALSRLAEFMALADGVARISLHPDGGDIHLLATVGPPRRPPLGPGEGLQLCRFPHSVDIPEPLKGLKTSNYLIFRLAKAHAAGRGCDDAVICDREGNVIEASTANLFAVFNGQLQTPPLASGALPGVTRMLVLECAAAIGIPCAEVPVGWECLSSADEIFITNSLLEVAPVTALLDLSVRFPADGPIASQLRCAVARL